MITRTYISLAFLVCLHVAPQVVTASNLGQTRTDPSSAEDELALLQVHLEHKNRANAHHAKMTSSFRSKECGAMVPFWRQAAVQLGEAVLSEDKLCFFIHGFYGMLFAKPLHYDLPSTRMTYIPTWKCASDGIRCNIEHSYRLSGVAGDKMQSRNHTLPFTFVREPLAHFVSGYSEINHRMDLYAHYGAELCDEGGTFGSYNLNSSDRALAYIKNMVIGNLSRQCWLHWHTFSMLAPMRDFNRHVGNVGFVGRLESFNKDWAQLKSLTNATFGTWDSECGAHQKSDARSGFGARESMSRIVLTQLSANLTSKHAMQKLLARHSHVSLVMHCAVLLPDYECLGYANPVAKEDCVQAGYASSVAAWDAAVTKLRVVLCPQIAMLSPSPDKMQ